MDQKAKTNQKRRYNFREVILHALAERSEPVTPKILLNQLLEEYYVSINASPVLLNRMLQKMARQGLIEFKYLSENYGVQLTPKGLAVFEVINLR